MDMTATEVLRREREVLASAGDATKAMHAAAELAYEQIVSSDPHLKATMDAWIASLGLEEASTETEAICKNFFVMGFAAARTVDAEA